MQRPAWKLLLFSVLLITLVVFAGAAQAQENAPAAQPQAAAAPYHRATAAFATPLPKPAGSPAASEGPDPDRKWEIEFHGGGMFATNPDGGSSNLPGPGASFLTLIGSPSRAVSSFYFGDGSLLFNQYIAAFAPCAGVCTPMTPLDPILTSRSADRDNGGDFGFRISRDITPRWAVEANFDYSLANLRIRSAALTGIEASRASWAAAWNNWFPFTFGTGISVTSTATVDRAEGHQIFGTAGVNVNLVTEGRLIPYLSVGGGALANTGDLPSALLVGNYQVTFLGPHNVTDTVLVNWEMPGVQGVGYVGGGFKYYVTPRWGFRLDVRDYLSGNGLRQTVSALPNVATLTPAESIAASGTTPDLNFSNDPTLDRDTLSGPALSHFRTFTGDGVRNQIVASGGIFFRF